MPDVALALDKAGERPGLAQALTLWRRFASRVFLRTLRVGSEFALLLAVLAVLAFIFFSGLTSDPLYGQSDLVSFFIIFTELWVTAAVWMIGLFVITCHQSALVLRQDAFDRPVGLLPPRTAVVLRDGQPMAYPLGSRAAFAWVWARLWRCAALVALGVVWRAKDGRALLYLSLPKDAGARLSVDGTGPRRPR